jgi:inner membrane transporter RhtA
MASNSTPLGVGDEAIAAHPAVGARNQRSIIPPQFLLLLSISSVQLGSALSKDLFPRFGPPGMVLLRTVSAALVLVIAWRPNILRFTATQWRTVLLFGSVVAAMNLSFYLAISRLPLGIVVTVEFLGPLGVALAGSRRISDLVWVLLAASGVALFGPWADARLDLLGLGLAGVAAALWSLYILLTARFGRQFSGGGGLAMSMAIATMIVMPFGVARVAEQVGQPLLILTGLGVGLLASAIPYSLELTALRHLPTRVFSIMMSLEPAMAAIAGWLVLRESLGPRALVAIALVTTASMGATLAPGKNA